GRGVRASSYVRPVIEKAITRTASFWRPGMAVIWLLAVPAFARFLLAHYHEKAGRSGAQIRKLTDDDNHERLSAEHHCAQRGSRTCRAAGGNSPGPFRRHAALFFAAPGAADHPSARAWIAGDPGLPGRHS